MRVCISERRSFAQPNKVRFDENASEKPVNAALDAREKSAMIQSDRVRHAEV